MHVQTPHQSQSGRHAGTTLQFSPCGKGLWTPCLRLVCVCWMRSMAGSIAVSEPHAVVEAGRAGWLLAVGNGGVHVHTPYQRRAEVCNGAVNIATALDQHTVLTCIVITRVCIVLWYRAMGSAQAYLQKDVVDRLSQPKSAVKSVVRSQSFSEQRNPGDADDDRFFDGKGVCVFLPCVPVWVCRAVACSCVLSPTFALSYATVRQCQVGIVIALCHCP